MKDYIPDGYLTLKGAADRVARINCAIQWRASEADVLLNEFVGPPTEIQLGKASKWLRGCLSNKHIKSHALSETGRWFLVPSTLWLSNEADKVFDNGLLPAGDLAESIRLRREGNHRRRILILESELEECIREAQKIGRIEQSSGEPTVVQSPLRSREPRDSKSPTPQVVEQDALRKNRIEQVVAIAKRRWRSPNERPPLREMAKAIHRDKGDELNFSCETIRKILGGSYGPMKKCGLTGLDG